MKFHFRNLGNLNNNMRAKNERYINISRAEMEKHEILRGSIQDNSTGKIT